MNPGPSRPSHALATVPWIGALALLVTNDRLLKGAGVLPGWLTGKLSDFAGLFVAGVLLGVLVRATTPRRSALAQLVVAAGFTAFKVVPALSDGASVLYGALGLEWRLVADATDLVALPTLVLAHLHLTRASRVRSPIARPLHGALAALGLVASAASFQPPSTTQPPPCGGDGIDCDGDGFTAPDDCNDADPDIVPSDCPGPTDEDACDDGDDNDGDGLADCRDPDCALACADLLSFCGSQTIAHDFASEHALTGSTLVGTSVTDGSCVGADSPEVIFSGHVSRPGILTVGIPPGHGVHLRASCSDAYTELACADETTVGGELQIQVDVDVPLTIVVEALDPLDAGEFEVPIEVHPPGCGDGALGADEQCDDGNWVSGDGCDGQCQLETPPVCAPADATLGDTTGDFVGASSEFSGPCAGSVVTPERIFRYTPTSSSVTATVQSSADVSLYAITGECPTGPSVGCSEQVGASGSESLTLPAVVGEPITIFVELAPGEPADATFTLTLSEP